MTKTPGYTLTASVCEIGDLILFQAIRALDGLPVLLKIPAALRPAPAFLRRLEREYELARDLDPERIARPLALERHAGAVALVLEQGPTHTLADLLGSPMDIRSFLQIAIGINAALAEIHGHELVHKDLKPEHVLLDAAGHVWLTGLGIASRLPRERQAPEPPEVIAGTLAYMAPEQTGRMNRSIDTRSDLYALGVTFYQMLTGVLPFAAGDAMEWVHCHIARQPEPPNRRISGIPELLSEMVMKLLAKTADERYLSTVGLDADLRRCLAQWESTGRIDHFQMGAHDVSDRLLIPEKLYGRKSEIDTLLAAFNRVVASGKLEIVLVSGYSGVGKTAVVNELHKALVPPRGLFAAGKFDQYKRYIPYATLVQALQALVLQILGKSEAEVAAWREALQQVVSPNGQLIVSLIPEVELIIGKQPPVPDLPPQEAQNRFQMVLRRFLGVFAGPEHPLVLFLDDLQWLDAAMLDLIEQLATGQEVHHLLLIGAYRDNEVGPTHPLMRIIEAIRKRGAGVLEIVLAPLSIDDVGSLVADALHCDRERALPLAQLVHEKTGGNPFFAIQFLTALAEEKLLAFDQGAGRWAWDLACIHAKGYTDNVVDLLVGKLGHLPAATLATMEQFACIGNVAQISTLSMAYGQSEEALHAAFWEAVRAGLVFRLEDSYAFLHDRVHEAAYALLPESRRKELHLKIGRLLLAQYSQEVLAERMFDVVDQFNRSVEIITDAEEKATLRRLNTAAGRKARAAAAYASAGRYFEQAVALLPPDPWDELYAESVAIFLELVESEYLSGNFAHSDELLTTALDHVITVPDQIMAYRMRLRLYQLAGRFNEALAAVLKALRLFGISFPETDADILAATEAEIRLISDKLRGRCIADLTDIPLSDDAETRAVIGLLEEAMPLIYLVRALLWPLITAKGVNLCLERGHADESPFVYSCYAMVLVGVVRDIPSAIQFSEMAIKLNERLPSAAAWRGKLLFHHGGLVNIWGNHFAENLSLLDKALQASLEAGDLANACYLTYNAIWLHLENGDPLEQVVDLARRYMAFAQQNHNEIVYNVDRMEAHFVLGLQGKTQSLTDFSDAAFNEAVCLAAIKQSGFGLGTAYHHIMKLVATYLAEEYAEALEWAVRTAPILLHVASMVNEVAYHFYHALTLAMLYPQALPEQQIEFKQTLEDVLGKLRFWSDNCPENFDNRYALVSAELARIEGRDMEAMRLYDQAIRSARDNSFVHQEALAAEVASRFYRARGFERIADAYLRDARACYARWGAQGKVRQLEQRYPHLRQALPLSASITFSTGTRDIDILSVVRASQALSGEILLDNLLKTLMRIVLENAGAQKGYLLLAREEGLSPAVEARVEKQNVVMHVQGEPGLPEAMLPASILNYVRRSRDKVLIDDATAPNPYIEDEYFSHRHPKSVLCLPIVKQTRLIGVLYLENELATHAFTPDRQAVLELLAAQAAISLENALVYEALQESESQYRRIVDTANEGIWMLGVDLLTTFVNGRMAEMIGYRVEEIIGRPVTDFMFEEDTPDFNKRMVDRRRGVSEHHELRFCHRNGEAVWILASAVPILDAGGSFKGAFGMLTDITERKRAEEEIRRLKNYLSNIIDSMPSVLVGLDRDETVTQWNRQAERISGISATEAVGRPITELLPDFSPWIGAMLSEIDQQRPVSMEKLLIEKEGERRFYDLMLYPLIANGVEGAVVRVEDVTERARIQELLIQTEKMMSVGGLAAGMAHEINNPLGIITQAAQNIERRVSPELPANRKAAEELGVSLEKINAYFEKRQIPEFIGSIRTAGFRAAKIVANMLQFSRRAGTTMQPVSLAGVIEQALELAASDYDLKKKFDFRSIEIIRDYEPYMPEVPAVPVEMAQVILNLLKNAAQAMILSPPARIPRITLRLRREERYALIEVEDNGPGMPEDVRRRVFEPFFTTKEPGMGTGLGLSVSYMIVTQNHKGLMEVESKPGKGACFTVRLPLSNSV